MIPGSGETINSLKPILPVIYAALKTGIEKAQEFFVQEGTTIDRVLAPNIVRWGAKRYLDFAGHNVEADEDYQREDLRNNGLLLQWQNSRIWILKSDAGALPPAGSSERKQDFYQANQFCFEFLQEDGQQSSQPTHLVLLWDVAPTTYALIGLRLSLPRSGGPTRDTTDAYWTEDIPNALLHAEAQAGEDLDIKLKEQEEPGEETEHDL